MKKILLTAMVLGSSVTLAACADNYNGESDLTGAPYAEDRTVGADNNVTRRPVVRSAEPVFEETQMK